MPVGCWDLDSATGTLNLCRHSRRMFGLDPESSALLTESEWVERFHPDDLAAVRDALTACLVYDRPYAQQFRTIHPDGSVQVVFGVGRTVKDHRERRRFVGWNFDPVSAGQVAGDWISAHPEAMAGEHLLSLISSEPQSNEASSGRMSPEALLARAHSILRVRRSRERLLGRAMLGEPAFDMLLCLYVRSGQSETSLTSLAKSANIPTTSALRWTAYLTDKGWVALTESMLDRRAISVQLTHAGRAVMDEFLAIR